ncbi:MAG: GAF domain-containing protein [Prochloraceae cyanobacterium]|nr:GAF domain-containing protein [Prochloraceae cyanobacterium]
MTQNSPSQPDSNEPKPKKASVDRSGDRPQTQEASSLSFSPRQSTSSFGKTREFVESNNNTEDRQRANSGKSENFLSSGEATPRFKKRNIALAAIICTIPVLAVGIASFYFASHHTTGEDPDAHKRILPMPLIGTGATGMLAGITGAMALILSNRLIGSPTVTAKRKQEIDEESIKREQLFKESIYQIHHQLEEKEILKASVEEARRVIGADRVIVYSLDDDLWGTIVAESVASDWPRALGTKMNDPCFKSHYFEKYQNGRIQVMNDIYEAHLTPCHLGQLEPLAVKASAVVPILSQGKLLGLLIAHQCSGPRIWQRSEVNTFAQIAAQTGLALHKARLLADFPRLQQQAQTEAQWTKLLTDATESIHASVSKQDILKAVVKQARRAIEADRVVIYSLNQESQGTIVAESVASDWPKALGSNIDDPCLSSRYMEEYRNGRIKAITNIYEANLTPCYLSQLEPFAVKASLIVPIISQDKLEGLLIAHQCSAPRNWQQSEIDLFCQIATQGGFALNKAKLLADVTIGKQQAETEAQWTKFFTDAVGNIRASTEEKELTHAAVEEARRVIEADRVVIYSLNNKSEGLIIAESVAPGWPKTLGVTVDDPCFSTRYIELYQKGRVQAIENVYEAHLTPCYLSQLEPFAVKASLVVPIVSLGVLEGLLIAHQCSGPRAWQNYEIRCFQQIATHIGFALEDSRMGVSFAKTSQNGNKQWNGDTKTIQELSTLFQDSEIVMESFSENLGAIDKTISQAADKVKHFGQSSHTISELIGHINDLAVDMKNKAINVTIEAGKAQNTTQESIVSLAKIVHSWTQKLSTATAEVQPLISQIEAEAYELLATIEVRKQNVSNQSELVEEVRQKLGRIAILSNQVDSDLPDKQDK